MTQSAPTVLLYGQALVLLKELQQEYQGGAIRTLQELTERLRAVLSQYQTTAGFPFLRFDPVVETEPPLSAKMNRYWQDLQYDITLIQQQLDILKASSVFTHNLLATEVLRAKYENSRVDNKLKTLQLYSDSVDTSIVTFGDSFTSEQFFDTRLVPEEMRVRLDGQGILSLGQLGGLVNLTKDAEIFILATSNGFSGNNQEIADPSHALRDPISNTPLLTFIAEADRSADLAALVDGEPNSWFEYEHCLVKETDRLLAGNLNFTYQGTSFDEDETNTFENSQGNDASGQINWAIGPSGGVLKLNIEFDLKSIQKLNNFSYIPYGLSNNSNFPVKVALIETSTDGTSWLAVSPENVFVATDPNLTAARTASNIVAGRAVWIIEPRYARYVRVHFEQAQPVNSPIGHLYYVTRDTSRRVEGPIPPLENPNYYYNPSRYVSGDLIQQREYFSGKRWAIGVRDFLIQQLEYQVLSVMITKPLRVSGTIDRVVLKEAEIFIPSDFDPTYNWVRFFISPDDGDTWYQISRIQDDYLGIPEEIAFNDPLPEAFREPGVAYYNTTKAVTSLRFKIEMERPDDQPSSTPYVRSYRLKVRKR